MDIEERCRSGGRQCQPHDPANISMAPMAFLFVGLGLALRRGILLRFTRFCLFFLRWLMRPWGLRRWRKRRESFAFLPCRGRVGSAAVGKTSRRPRAITHRLVFFNLRADDCAGHSAESRARHGTAHGSSGRGAENRTGGSAEPGALTAGRVARSKDHGRQRQRRQD